jgi:ribonucleoside-diphosphate reductase alpha chain
VTVNIRDTEWDQVRDWVWDRFGEMTGVAFLPWDGGTYAQAPYEKVSEATLKALSEAMPILDWGTFVEDRDNFVEKAECSAGICQI